jgi:hypothetical protein
MNGADHKFFQPVERLGDRGFRGCKADTDVAFAVTSNPTPGARATPVSRTSAAVNAVLSVLVVEFGKA